MQHFKNNNFETDHFQTGHHHQRLLWSMKKLQVPVSPCLGNLPRIMVAVRSRELSYNHM